MEKVQRLSRKGVLEIILGNGSYLYLLMIKIYTLKDPFTNEIRYVGKTKYSLNDRLCKHLITYERNHRANWIRKILKQGKKPIIELVEEVDERDWKFWEKYWIEQFRQWGFNLTNATEGGESGIISPQCRVACIKANKGRKPTTENIVKRIAKLNKCVLQLTIDGSIVNEFISASEAGRQTNSNLSHITECCNNIRKTHNGFKWKYK